MAPLDPHNSDNLDDHPDYFTPDRIVSHSILSSAQQVLNYRSFLIRNAARTINEIRTGSIDFDEPITPVQGQNIIRALNAEIIQETVSIIEALAAVSMNPDDPPEDRAKQLLTYRNREIHDFFDTIDDSTDLDRFASIFSYPDFEDLDIAEADEPYYRAHMRGNLEAYRDFYLVAKEAWDVLRTARNKITHGFFILMNDDQVLIDEHADIVDLPDWCDDYLATARWDDDDFEPHVLLMGDRPRETYLTISRNAAIVQNHLLHGLKRQIENQGEPVYPEFVYGEDLRPEDEPETRPTSDIVTVDASYEVVLNDEFREQQEQLFDDVEELTEQHR